MMVLYPNLCHNEVCYKGTSVVCYSPLSGKFTDRVQSLYNAMFGVHRNGLCYK